MFNQKKNKYLAGVMALLFCFSCRENKTQNISKPNYVEGKNNTLIQPDTNVLPLVFIELKKNFNNNSPGKTDSSIHIPFQLINSFISDTLSTSFYNSINPVAKVENASGYFFIIKANCIAGGDCASYYLLKFDKKGTYNKILDLGMLAAEESSSTYFKYKIVSDSLLITYEIDYDEEKRMAVDTVVKYVNLSIP